MTRGRFIDRARRRVDASTQSVRSRSTLRAWVFRAILSAPLAMALTTGALAYWTSSGSGTATAAVGTLNAPTKLALTYRTGTSSVKVSWEGSKLSNGTDAQGYYVTHNNGTSTSAAACGTSPTSLITSSTSCTDTAVPDGTYTYRVIAVWKSFSAESVASEAVTVKLDTTKPTAAISFPSPSGNGIYRSETWTEGCNVLSFKVTDSICGTAQDNGGGDVLTRVQISIQAPSGKYWESSKKEWAASSEQKLTASGTASWMSSFPETNFSQTGGGDGTYTVRAYATDEVGNESTATTTSFVLDTTAPTSSLSLTSASHAYLSSGTLYYKGNGSGSFSLLDAVTDSGSGPASATFPAISTGGWMHNAQTVSTSTGSNPTISYTSSSYSWTTPLTNPADQTITATDVAGNSGTSGGTIKFVSDTTAPTSGALSVNSTSASSGGSTSTATNSTSFAISSRTDYAETQSASQSGLASSTLTVQSETFSNNSCVAPGSGGPFPTATTIVGTTQPSGIVTGYCYLYTLTGIDNVGNAASISTTVAVDTTAPSTPTLSFNGLSSNAYYSSATNTLWFRAANGGTFTVAAPSSDPESGVKSGNAGYTFSSLAGNNFTLVQTGDQASYTFGTTATQPSSDPTVFATNNFNLDSSNASYHLLSDTTAPSGGSISVPAYSKTTSVAITFSAGTDAGSGINTAFGQLKHAEATYTESTDICGSFSVFANVGSTGEISPYTNTGLSGGKCYEYEYVVSDQVGNTATYVTITPVKVDIVAPSAPTLPLYVDESNAKPDKITGTTDANATITAVETLPIAAKTYSTTAASNGSYSLAVEAVEGGSVNSGKAIAVNYSVTVTDAAGNQSTATTVNATDKK